MQLRPMLLMVLAAGLAAPPVAGAAKPRGGWYVHEAAATQRPWVSLDVSGQHARLLSVSGVRCLRTAVPPSTWLTIRGGRIDARIRLAPRGTPGSPRDQLAIQGRWISSYTVSGRLRVVAARAQVHGRRLYCDSGWRRWRTASVAGFGVRTSVPDEFPVPGMLTTTVIVYNDGDYDSARTKLTVLPRSLAGSTPARPAPVISTTHGTCRWPTNAAWAHWMSNTDNNSAILCNLGRVRARTRATITITESWSLAHCVYDPYGDGLVETSWETFASSPLQPYDISEWHIFPGEDVGGRCPSLIPEEWFALRGSLRAPT